jgi:hypothetical protein
VEFKNITGILTGSNIVATQENYSYILWSGLALVFIIASLVLVRKGSQ